MDDHEERVLGGLAPLRYGCLVGVVPEGQKAQTEGDLSRRLLSWMILARVLQMNCVIKFVLLLDVVDRRKACTSYGDGVRYSTAPSV